MAPSIEPPTLSGLLRSGTREEHEHAERMGFVETLMSGGFGVHGAAAYADLAAQQHAIYAALERAGERVRTAPDGGGIVFDELERTPRIAADLHALLGADWSTRTTVLPATEQYVRRLDELGDWVGGYAAHAYTRYLGDLSGGQVIKVMLQRHYGLGEDVLNFYTFDAIAKPKVFKDTYRAALDGLDIDPQERDRVVEEARAAFRLNQTLFAELGAAHLPVAQGA